MSTLWILTREINEYDQDGEYFVAGWRDKPSEDEIRKFLNVGGEKGGELVRHILNGGGRQGVEEQWYFLREVGEGEK